MNCARCGEPLGENDMKIVLTTFLDLEGTVVCENCHRTHGSFGCIENDKLKEAIEWVLDNEEKLNESR
jgi:hypothetical protein